MKRSRNTIQADLTSDPATNKRVKVDRQPVCLIVPKRIRASKQSVPTLPIDDMLEDAVLGLAELMSIVDARKQAHEHRRLEQSAVSSSQKAEQDKLILTAWYSCEWEKEQVSDRLLGDEDDPIVID